MIALGAIVMCGRRLNWQGLPVLCHDLSVCIYTRVVSTSRPDKVEAAWSESPLDTAVRYVPKVCNQRWGRGISSLPCPSDVDRPMPGASNRRRQATAVEGRVRTRLGGDSR